MIWGEPRGNEASRARSNITPMASFAYGLSYLSEEDIPGNSLNGRDRNRLKNSDLQFWLKCRGDSGEGNRRNEFAEWHVAWLAE